MRHSVYIAVAVVGQVVAGILVRLAQPCETEAVSQHNSTIMFVDNSHISHLSPTSSFHYVVFLICSRHAVTL